MDILERKDFPNFAPDSRPNEWEFSSLARFSSRVAPKKVGIFLARPMFLPIRGKKVGILLARALFLPSCSQQSGDFPRNRPIFLPQLARQKKWADFP